MAYKRASSPSTSVAAVLLCALALAVYGPGVSLAVAKNTANAVVRIFNNSPNYTEFNAHGDNSFNFGLYPGECYDIYAPAFDQCSSSNNCFYVGSSESTPNTGYTSVVWWTSGSTNQPVFTQADAYGKDGYGGATGRWFVSGCMDYTNPDASEGVFPATVYPGAWNQSPGWDESNACEIGVTDGGQISNGNGTMAYPYTMVFTRYNTSINNAYPPTVTNAYVMSMQCNSSVSPLPAAAGTLPSMLAAQALQGMGGNASLSVISPMIKRLQPGLDRSNVVFYYGCLSGTPSATNPACKVWKGTVKELYNEILTEGVNHVLEMLSESQLEALQYMAQSMANSFQSQISAWPEVDVEESIAPTDVLSTVRQSIADMTELDDLVGTDSTVQCYLQLSGTLETSVADSISDAAPEGTYVGATGAAQDAAGEAGADAGTDVALDGLDLLFDF